MYEAILVSRADYPIIIKYDGQSKVVSPREKFFVDKLSLIEGKLPPQIKVQKIN